MFCGEAVIKFGKRVEVWADSGVATMGATEGTLQRASQPSIIMQPDSAMPMGPSRTHSTRIISVATRQPLIRWKYPAGDLLESSSWAREGRRVRLTRRRGHPPRVQVASPQVARHAFESSPDWIRSTSTFHSSLVRTARFPASPIRTCSPANSTSGQAPQPRGHSNTFRLSNVFTSFLSRSSVARCDGRPPPRRVVLIVRMI